MSLKVYNRKRNFSKTPEPKGKEKKGKGRLRFVVQMHHASRPHFDLRLEFGGVFRSWAVPKGPSLNPNDQRLAVFVEDHPLNYGSFEGIIPPGNYGAGTVMLWDEGTYVERSSKDRKESEAAMLKGLKKGHLTFVLDGKKLKGEFALIQLKKGGKDNKAWLLVKKRDNFASFKKSQIPDDISVKTNRSIEQIAEESESQGDIWLSKRKTQAPPQKKPAATTKLDLMPRKNKPMLATMGKAIPKGDWYHEKFQDGTRAIAEVENKRVGLYSKAGLPFEKKFPKIVEELKALNLNAVLDGEIVKSTYSVFDILYFDGKDLRKEPLKNRLKILKTKIKSGKIIRLAEEAKTGKIIARNLDSVYKSGTTSDWLIIEQQESKKEPAKSDGPQLTHLDKVFWPEEGITKGDVLNYYKSISKYILPYLKDRPESLNRHPNGINAAGFYQKDMTGHLPRFLKTERIFSESAEKSVDYALCQDENSLLYLVNLGCIELNPWFSRVGHLEKPDFLVIDLDPDGNDFNHVIEIAHEVHDILKSVGAESFCKTSGATGIHIGVPTGAKYTFDEVREFAEEVCKIVAKKYPSTTSLDRNPNRRKKKIYLDFMQNRRGQTLAAPYCIRPRPCAPVSMPLEWKELRKGLKPEQFNIKNALRVIEQKKDSWKGVLGKAIDLKKCMKALLKLDQ